MPAEIAERARSREALQAEVGVFPPLPTYPTVLFRRLCGYTPYKPAKWECGNEYNDRIMAYLHHGSESLGNIATAYSTMSVHTTT
jgi:hypothetical protein